MGDEFYLRPRSGRTTRCVWVRRFQGKRGRWCGEGAERLAAAGKKQWGGDGGRIGLHHHLLPPAHSEIPTSMGERGQRACVVGLSGQGQGHGLVNRAIANLVDDSGCLQEDNGCHN